MNQDGNKDDIGRDAVQFGNIFKTLILHHGPAEIENGTYSTDPEETDGEFRPFAVPDSPEAYQPRQRTDNKYKNQGKDESPSVGKFKDPIDQRPAEEDDPYREQH